MPVFGPTRRIYIAANYQAAGCSSPAHVTGNCSCVDWSGGGDPNTASETCTFITHWDSPGVKTVTATPDCGDSQSKQVTIVEVASLLPDVGTEIDDGDDNPDTKSFVVCVAATGVVTVTATPNPSVSEENLPACWSLTGGNVQDKLHTEVDKTTAGVTTITCTCNTSSKTTKIYVYEAKLNLYAKGGLSYIPQLVTLGDFGHSWWKLEFSHPELIQPPSLRLFVDEDIGYWPAEGFPLYNPFAYVEGLVVVGDQGCTEWATGEWTLTLSELRYVLYYSMILRNAPGEFSAWYHNCTDEAVIAGEVAGVETIDASGNPTLPLVLFLYLLIH